MNLETAKNELTSIFKAIFHDQSLELNDSMTANDIDEWDSLTHINLIVAVEKHFKIKFTTKEATSMKNVGEFIHLILRKTSS